jgi:hypothetical protein
LLFFAVCGQPQENSPSVRAAAVMSENVLFMEIPPFYYIISRTAAADKMTDITKKVTVVTCRILSDEKNIVSTLLTNQNRCSII